MARLRWNKLLDWAYLGGLLLLPLAAVCAKPLQPIEQFPVLFPAVQHSGILSNEKEFADAVPKHSPEVIRELYRARLKRFVEQHFEVPNATTAVAISTSSTAATSLRQHTVEVLRQVHSMRLNRPYDTLIPVPNEQIVGGGGAREQYYWDSYFIALGLQQLGDARQMRNQLDNLVASIERVGFIANSNRSYTQTRSNPPVFSLMVKQLAELEGPAVVSDYLPYMVQEYEYWMRGSAELSPTNFATGRAVRMPNGSVLNRYWDDDVTPRPEHYIYDMSLLQRSSRDPHYLMRNVRASAASGWTLSNRWLLIPNMATSVDTIDVVPVDLNSLLFHLEQTIAEGYRLSGDEDLSNQYLKLANRRAEAIQTYLWDGHAGVYQDFQITKGTPTGRLSIAMVFPLWMNLASEEQARRVALNIEYRFLRAGGVMVTEMPSNAAFAWDSPNGWAPMQWIAVTALTNYNQTDLAELIAKRWIELNQRVYQRYQRITAIYNVDHPQYPEQLEFSYSGESWAAGVLLRLLDDYPQYQMNR